MQNDSKIHARVREFQEQRLGVAREVGIDADCRVLECVYSEPSGVIIVAVERSSTGVFEQRLFLRHQSKNAYHRLCSASSDVHYSEVVASGVLPVAYCMSRRITATATPGEFAADWLTVERVDLAKHTCDSVISKGSLRLPDPYSNGWIVKLIGVSADDSVVFCTCAMQRPGDGTIHHWLCGVELNEQKASLISRFEGTWF